uniref:Uncharacterized protein n=1 Tax=Anopheles atroparvus TaxID=41427 RepID=A0A182JLZ1_ANOAO
MAAAVNKRFRESTLLLEEREQDISPDESGGAHYSAIKQARRLAGVIRDMPVALEDHRYVGTMQELTNTLARVEEERDQMRQEVLNCKLAAEEGKRQCQDLNARLIKLERAQKGKAGRAAVAPAEQAPAKEKPSPKATEEKNDGFTVVGKKGKPAKPKPAAPKKRKEPRPKTRPDALLLKVQKGSSYAAVLKTLKTKREELKEIGEAAAKVRRSGDNVLFELTSAGSQGIGQLVESLQTELGGTATVATLRQTSIVVIRDVCEEVDRAEIRDDLMDQLQVQGNPNWVADASGIGRDLRTGEVADSGGYLNAGDAMDACAQNSC